MSASAKLMGSMIRPMFAYDLAGAKKSRHTSGGPSAYLSLLIR